MCVLWNKILQRFQKTSTLLQSTNIDINMAVSLFLSLESFVAELRDQFDELENEAKNLMESVQQVFVSEKRYQIEDEGVKLNLVHLQGAQKFDLQSFVVIIDKLPYIAAYKSIWHISRLL